MKALQDAQDHAKSEIQARRDDQEEKYRDAIESLSAGVDIVDDGWFDGLSDGDKALLVRFSLRSDSNYKFLGSWRGYRVFTGKFMGRTTRRKSKGYMVNDHVGDVIESTVPRGSSFHVEEKELKAIMRISADSNEVDIHSARYRLYSQGGLSRDSIPYFAKQILEGES
ncbi:MAG: hypothetical protein KC592_14370 [Nitrospira sp.]|nr:hypothetical protein [Nitrospira sp.]